MNSTRVRCPGCNKVSFCTIQPEIYANVLIYCRECWGPDTDEFMRDWTWGMLDRAKLKL